MPGRSMTLTGWKAAVVVAVLMGAGVVRVKTSRTKIDAHGRRELETWIQGKLIRPALADTTRSLSERGAALLKASSVTIRSLEVRGPLSNAVVRVELAPSPALPTGTDLVQYYRMRYSRISGWTPRGKATKLSWYVAAF